jgi:hypothetical protein
MWELLRSALGLDPQRNVPVEPTEDEDMDDIWFEQFIYSTKRASEWRIKATSLRVLLLAVKLELEHHREVQYYRRTPEDAWLWDLLPKITEVLENDFSEDA